MNGAFLVRAIPKNLRSVLPLCGGMVPRKINVINRRSAGGVAIAMQVPG